MIGVLTGSSGAGATTMYPYLSVQTAQAAPSVSAAPAIGAPGVKSTLGSQPLIMLFALIALVLLAKWATESKSSDMELAHIHVGGYNFLMITVIAIVGIDVFKLIFTRWNVPGLSPVIQMA